MLFKHPFREGSLKSFPEVIYSDKTVNIEADIADQEGPFVYETAAMFLKPHNIHIIKIVSDLLKAEQPVKVYSFTNCSAFLISLPVHLRVSV